MRILPPHPCLCKYFNHLFCEFPYARNTKKSLILCGTDNPAAVHNDPARRGNDRRCVPCTTTRRLFVAQHNGSGCARTPPCSIIELPVRGRRGEPHVQGAAYAHPRADPRTPQTHRVRPRARGSAAREIRPAAEILIRVLSFRSTPKAPPVFRRGFRDFCPISTPAHSSCSMRENASRNVSRLRTVSCTSGAPSTVTA